MQYGILMAIQGIANPILDTLANTLSLLGEEGVMILILVIVYYIVDKKAAFTVFSSLVFGQLVTNSIKAIVRAPRPFMVHSSLAAGRLDTATGYSFPSGHTTGAAAFYPALARESGKRWAIAAAIVLAILIGLSRNYLAVHWPVDVLVGLFIGLVFSLGFTSVFDRIYSERKRRLAFSKWAAAICLAAAFTLMLALSLFGADERAFSDLMKVLALSGGAYGGVTLETRKASFRVERRPGRALAAVAMALAGVALTMVVKLIVPEALYYLGAFVRYSMLGFWAIGLCPLICCRLGLLEREDADSSRP